MKTTRGVTLGLAVLTFIAAVILLVVILVQRNSVPDSTVARNEIASLQTVAVPATASTNAADSYRQAAELIRQLRASAADGARLERYESAQFDADAADFFHRYAPIIRLAQTGAAQPQCQWDQPQADAQHAILSDMRGIARFCLAHAQYAAAQGQPDIALEDAFTILGIARHAGTEPLIVNKLVEIAIENQGIDAMAKLLPALSREQIATLPRRLDALPRSTTGRELMDGELRHARRSMSAQDGGLVGGALVEGYAQFAGEVAPAIDSQAPDEFARTVDTLLAKYKLNGLVQIVGPSLKRMQETLAAGAVKRAMLRAAMGIQISGKPSPELLNDPIGGEAFGYRETPDGFELSSKFQHRGKPITLTVSQTGL